MHVFVTANALAATKNMPSHLAPFYPGLINFPTPGTD